MGFKKDSRVLIIMLLFYYDLFSQNLVLNGNFEKHKLIQLIPFRNLGSLAGWKNPTSATPDYSDWPQNAYCGLGLHVDSTYGKRYYRHVEYIETKLFKNLISGNLYCLKMLVKRHSNEYYSLNAINYTLTTKYLRSRTEGILNTPYYYKLTSSMDTLLRDRKNWMAICSVFEAKGNEKFLTIGYFNPELKLVKVDKRKPEFYAAYYLIDDVSLIEIKDTSECDCRYKPKPTKQDTLLISQKNDLANIGDKIILENIYFEKDKWELKEIESKAALEEIIKILKSNPSMQIEIGGHTDNSGDETKNTMLSEKRAKAVADYLINHDIEQSRVISKGYASSQPIADNESEDNRKQNRRVEFKILNK